MRLYTREFLVFFLLVILAGTALVLIFQFYLAKEIRENWALPRLAPMPIPIMPSPLRSVYLRRGPEKTYLDVEASTLVKPDYEYAVIINIAARSLYRYDKKGRLLNTYRVAPGMPGFPTPVDNYNIREITYNPPWYIPKSKWAEKYRNKYGSVMRTNTPMGDVKMRLTETVLMHGTRAGDRHTVENQTLASHACVRMLNEDALALAESLELGTPVRVINRAVVVHLRADRGVSAWIFRQVYDDTTSLEALLHRELKDMELIVPDTMICQVLAEADTFYAKHRKDWCYYVTLREP